jgi:hypothetical protein
MSQASRQPISLETSPFEMNHGIVGGDSAPDSRDELERQKQLLNSEIERLRTLISEASREDGKALGVRRGIQVLLETKERLIRQEFERKYQELAGEVRRQRKQHTEQVDKMKRQLADCICNMTH